MRDPRLGARVRELRLLRGWSQKQLADKTSTSREAVCRDERLGGFSLDRVLRYAGAFGVVPELILEVLDEEAQPCREEDAGAETAARKAEDSAGRPRPGEPWLRRDRPRGSA